MMLRSGLVQTLTFLPFDTLTTRTNGKRSTFVWILTPKGGFENEPYFDGLLYVGQMFNITNDEHVQYLGTVAGGNHKAIGWSTYSCIAIGLPHLQWEGEWVLALENF